MSMWEENPEFFEKYALERALKGDLGPALQAQAMDGEITGSQIWAAVNKATIQDLKGTWKPWNPWWARIIRKLFSLPPLKPRWWDGLVRDAEQAFVANNKRKEEG